jgi:hypothetical protein
MLSEKAGRAIRAHRPEIHGKAAARHDWQAFPTEKLSLIVNNKINNNAEKDPENWNPARQRQPQSRRLDKMTGAAAWRRGIS